jgi:hypothetical protein
VDPSLGIETVADRLYRGFCRSPQVTQFVRQEFINKESAIMAAIDNNAYLFEPKQIESMKKYTKEFFVIFKDDNRFKQNITDKCRTK